MNTSRAVPRIVAVTAILAALLAVSVVRAAGPVTVTVAFSASAQAKLERYGKEEGEGVKARIETAIISVCKRARAPEEATVAVTVEDIAPTHPTRAQLAANPSIDPVKSRSLGGASLTGVVRDGRGQVLATVKHRHYPPSLEWGSPSLDPWADADIAIEQFASEVGKACGRASAG